MKTQAELFLSDLTFNTQFRFLEEAKDKNELLEIAKKARIDFPSPDLSIFKCVYAYIDRQNKNGCTLPKEEVEKALSTLVGKSIDFDHFRKRVVGHWIDAKVEDNQIIAYGAFFKSSFEEDFDLIKELFSKGDLAISFEAWGKRTMNSGGGYDLKDIVFAGGALLLKEKPAFPGAEVLEMSQKRVLEFASVMTEPQTYISELSEYDLESFEGSDEELDDLIAIEIENSKVLTTKKRNAISDDLFAVIKTVKNKKSGGTRKVRMFPIHDESHVRNALARLPQATKTLEKLGISPETVKNKILKRARALNMKDLVARHQGTDDLEESRYYIYDANAIMQTLSPMECPCCGEAGMQDIMMMDYQNNKAKTKCMNCSGESMVNMTPQPTLTKKGRKILKQSDLAYKGAIEDFKKYIEEFEGPEVALEILIEQSLDRPLNLSYENRNELTDEDFAIVANIGEKNKKIRIFPIHSLAHINEATAKLEQSQVVEFMNKLGLPIDNVTRKISRRKINTAMKNLMEKYKKGTATETIQEIAKATIGREMTKEELEKAYSLVDLKGKSTNSDTSLQSVGDETPANDNHAKKSAAPSNETSLQTAEVTEDEVKAIITQATKKEEAKPATDNSVELAQLKTQIADLTKKLEEATTELSGFKVEKVAKEKAEKDALIKSRKEALGEFGKDMKDEDLLDEVKFKIASLEKENADLRAGKKVEPKKLPEFSKGSEDKGPVVPEARKKVNDLFLAGIDKETQEQK